MVRAPGGLTGCCSLLCRGGGVDTAATLGSQPPAPGSHPGCSPVASHAQRVRSRARSERTSLNSQAWARTLSSRVLTLAKSWAFPPTGVITTSGWEKTPTSSCLRWRFSELSSQGLFCLDTSAPSLNLERQT